MYFTAWLNINSTLFSGPIYGQLIPTSELSHTNKASISRRKHHDQLKEFSLRCFRKGWSWKIRYFERQICHVLTLEPPEHVCLCLKPSACRETKLFCLTKRSPIKNILIFISISHVSIRARIPIQLVLYVPFRAWKGNGWSTSSKQTLTYFPRQCFSDGTMS